MALGRKQGNWSGRRAPLSSWPSIISVYTWLWAAGTLWARPGPAGEPGCSGGGSV